MGPGDRRVEGGNRIKLDQSAKLIAPDGQVHPIKLKDVSRDGCRFGHHGISVRAGDIVTIQTSRSEARAELQWVKDQEAGATFV